MLTAIYLFTYAFKTFLDKTHTAKKLPYKDIHQESNNLIPLLLSAKKENAIP